MIHEPFPPNHLASHLSLPQWILLVVHTLVSSSVVGIEAQPPMCLVCDAARPRDAASPPHSRWLRVRFRAHRAVVPSIPPLPPSSKRRECRKQHCTMITHFVAHRLFPARSVTVLVTVSIGLERRLARGDRCIPQQNLSLSSQTLAFSIDT
jgi:hypothetical protein